MSDVTELFTRVAPDIDATPAPDVVDADLARGRAALTRDHRRRTIRRSLASGATIAAAIAVTVALTQAGAGSAAKPGHQANRQPAVHPTPHHGSSKVPPATHHTAPVRLVAYNGKQLAGFTVDKVPTGWFLSTSTQYALLIDPDGSTDNDPDAFVGKLAVLTQSTDVHGLPKHGTKVTVNGQAGVVTDQGSYGISLTYTTPSGFGVVIQAPPALNWSSEQIVDFATGVHVTSNAIPGKG
ncbi:MAG TPA: hypothetical protein VME70_06910 [Mycobacteriales bacterium]|nr:hypothetical protein [Mycobacteriales bacterium]